jgi:hypothetical protein
MFNKLIENSTLNGVAVNKSLDSNTVSIYPISEYNLEAIKYLIENCSRSNQENINVRIATIDTSLWLGDFLDKYWNKISYVCTLPSFDVLKVEGNKIVTKTYRVGSKDFHSDAELDSFFNEGKWKKFVIYTITKYADLSTMKTFYNIRYADITEKYEVRDNKINSILETGKDLLGDDDWLSTDEFDGDFA